MKNIKDFDTFSGTDGYLIVDGTDENTPGGKKLLSDIVGINESDLIDVLEEISPRFDNHNTVLQGGESAGTRSPISLRFDDTLIAVDDTSYPQSTSKILSVKNPVAPTTRANDGDVLTYSDTDGIVWSAPAGGGGGNPYTKVSVTPGTSYANGNVTDYGWNLFDQDVNIVNNTYSIVSEEIGYDSSKEFPDSSAIDVFKIKMPANTDFPMAVVEFQLKIGQNASVNKVEVYVGETKLTQVKDAPYRDDAVIGKSIDYDNEIVHHTEFGNNYWTLGGIWDRNIASAYTGIVNDSFNHIYVKVQVHIFGSCFRVMTSHQGDIPPAS